jgi:hypothetical protein
LGQPGGAIWTKNWGKWGRGRVLLKGGDARTFHLAIKDERRRFRLGSQIDCGYYK